MKRTFCLWVSSLCLLASTASADAPVRYAKMRIQAVKSFQEQQPDGTYADKSEIICEKTGEAAVFAQGSGAPEFDSSKIIECETTLKVGASRLMIMGFVGELRNEDVFGDGQTGDYKSFGTSVWVQSKNGTYAKSLPPTIVATSPDAHLMLLKVLGQNLSSDQQGDRVLEESITVTFKIED